MQTTLECKDGGILIFFFRYYQDGKNPLEIEHKLLYALVFQSFLLLFGRFDLSCFCYTGLHMNQKAITAALDACLLSDEEMKSGNA